MSRGMGLFSELSGEIGDRRLHSNFVSQLIILKIVAIGTYRRFDGSTGEE
jgi:hypothetical protein